VVLPKPNCHAGQRVLAELWRGVHHCFGSYTEYWVSSYMYMHFLKSYASEVLKTRWMASKSRSQWWLTAGNSVICLFNQSDVLDREISWQRQWRRSSYLCSPHDVDGDWTWRFDAPFVSWLCRKICQSNQFKIGLPVGLALHWWWRSSSDIALHRASSLRRTSHLQSV